MGRLVDVSEHHLFVNELNLMSGMSTAAVLTAGLKRGGGVLSFRASVERFLTTLLWMAQLMQ